MNAAEFAAARGSPSEWWSMIPTVAGICGAVGAAIGAGWWVKDRLTDNLPEPAGDRETTTTVHTA